MGAKGRRGDALLARLSRRTTGGRWIPEIDGLRFLAIALVLADHAAVAVDVASRGSIVQAPFGAASPPARPDPILGIFSAGSVGVLVFFMVSGFVLALPFIRHRSSKTGPVDLGRYFRRRVTRIEPPYLIIMMVLFLVASLTGAHVGLGHLVASLVYLHGTYYGTDSPLNSVAWSLEIEVQFYLLVPALALLLCAGRRIARRGRIVLLATLAIGFQVLGLMTAYTFLGSSIQFFLLGWLLADIYVTDWDEHPRRGRVWDLVGFATVPALLVVLTVLSPSIQHALVPWLVFALGYSAFRSVDLRRMLSNRWIATIGGMCYSIYLVHYSLFIIASRLLGSVAGTSPSVALFGACALLIPLAIVVGGFFFVLIERPCMDPLWAERALRRMRITTQRGLRTPKNAVIVIPRSDDVGARSSEHPIELVDS